jgi:hypothetical protein
MTSIKSLLRQRLPKSYRVMSSIKWFLLRLPPKSYRVRRNNQRLRREIEEHPDRALIVWQRENSSQLWYLFHGRAEELMMQPLTFLRETGLIHTNLILLKDYYRFFYHAGLNREITDVDAIIARLRRCREKLPHVRQTFCLGTSAGGYAAILFGYYLHVDLVYAFGPPTRINLDRLKKSGGCKDIWRIPEQHRDLARLLAKHNGQTRYKIFYCDGYGPDRAYAEHLQDLPGVELHPQPGNTHYVVQPMYESGRLREIFDNAPSDATISEPRKTPDL